jgi:RES domain-containing protein
MVLYRIAKIPFIRDLSGSGARRYGGRWNPKGLDVIYTSENRALAALELFVHLSRAVIPPDLSVVSLKIPEKASRRELTLKGLPRNWRSYPAPPELAEIGASWIRSKESLLLRVPSVIMPPEKNVLINPAHPEIIGVRIIEVAAYSFDKSLTQ